MAFCGSCGAGLSEGTAYCGSCGARLAASPALDRTNSASDFSRAQPAVASAPAGSAPAVAGAAMPANVAGALAYILGALTGILFLVLEPYRNDRLVRFHAFQSIFFFAV